MLKQIGKGFIVGIVFIFIAIPYGIISGLAEWSLGELTMALEVVAQRMKQEGAKL